MAELQVLDVSKSFGRVTALRGVSLVLRPDEILGLVGPNGAGKSTLFRIMAGALRPDGTTDAVRLGNGDPIDAGDVGYAPEHPPVYPELTVWDQLRFVARLQRVPRGSVRAAVTEAVARAGLKGVEGRLIGHLSKGYRQRVGLAQALVGEACLLLLDEPTSGMDPNQVQEFHQMVTHIKPGRFIVYSSHQIGGVISVANRVAVLHRGELRGSVKVATVGNTWWRLPLDEAAQRFSRDPRGEFSWFLSSDGSAVFLQQDGLEAFDAGRAVSDEGEEGGQRFNIDQIFALATRE